MTHPLTPREKVARCIIGPRNPVPDSSKFTLDQLRHVQWDATSESEKSDALWASDAILTALADHIGEPAGMVSNHAELARLAEAAKALEPKKSGQLCMKWWNANEAFQAAAHPATVLALLAEIAALRGGVQSLEVRRDFYKHNMQRAEARATEAERKLAEAVGLLRNVVTLQNNGDLDESISAFLNKEAERVPPAPGAEDA